jgi:hypothetical protein
MYRAISRDLFRPLEVLLLHTFGREGRHEAALVKTSVVSHTDCDLLFGDQGGISTKRTHQKRPERHAFNRPYGTEIAPLAHFPSSELLGYYRMSLRDRSDTPPYKITSGRKSRRSPISPAVNCWATIECPSGTEAIHLHTKSLQLLDTTLAASAFRLYGMPDRLPQASISRTRSQSLLYTRR